MQIQEFSADGRVEIEILHGMVVDQSVIGRVATVWSAPGLFSNQSANALGSLLVEHFRKHGKPACLSGMGSLVREWSEGKDESLVGLVDKLASSIPDMPVEAPGRLLDVAGRHFRKVTLLRELEASKNDLDAGNLDRAESRISKFSRIEMGLGTGFVLDKPSVESAFAANAQERLIVYDQSALDLFFHNELERTGFMVFAAPQKSGKTWWLVDLAIRAHRERRRVAFFEVGDLSETQLKKRLLTRVARQPCRSETGKWPFEVQIPKSVSCGVGRDALAEIRSVPKVFSAPLDAKRAWEAWEREKLERVKSKKDRFKASVHGNLSISILGIRSLLETWAREGWRADCVFIDYMDNLAPVDKREEVRDRVNTTWKLARAMAIEMDLLIVSATQVNAAGFGKYWLDRANFSEDNRKLSHVTAMAGINVSGTEKERGLARLNWIVKREGGFATQAGPVVAGCLPLGNPAVVSCWPERD